MAVVLTATVMVTGGATLSVSEAAPNSPLRATGRDKKLGSPEPPHVEYETPKGVLIHGHAERALGLQRLRKHRGQVQLVFTSPPFPLNNKKKYGNRTGEEYVEWLASFGRVLKHYLAPGGSVVVEIGNAWEPGKPTMSTLALEAMLAFLKKGGFHLCQQFVCFNPARLPSPAPWVTIERIRVKDAFTHVWWMSATERPKADNRRVLRAYSGSMKKLLASEDYNAGTRPSEHHISIKSFLRDNGGAIPPNVLTFSNTTSYDPYQVYCREHEIRRHPARMPPGLPEFFIRFLTDEDDLVMDPFAGSNTTGAVAEEMGRRWIAIEPLDDYVRGSVGRFPALSGEPPPVEA